ncbi:MAG: UPF0158 family protein [Candidatus Binatia bacterium]
MAGRIRIDSDLLLEAMTRSPDWEAYLDLETGVVTLHPSGSDDLDELDDEESEAVPHGGVEIPRVESREEYRLMAQFATDLDEDDVREQLELALDGRGAFGRFRQVLARHPDLRARWERRHDEWLLAEARLWLEGLGVDAELRPGQPHGPPPEPPSDSKGRGPHIGLVELLLLGAPDGKTELLDGKVRRVFRARSGGEARAVFKSVARELCEFHGTAWRNRFIEGRNRFSAENAEVAVEGNDVELVVEVSAELWRRFSS